MSEDCIRRIIMAGYDNPIPAATFILSGGTVENPKTGKRMSCTYTDEDCHRAVTGGADRVIAASYLAKIYPDMHFVTTSVDKGYPDTGFSHARVMGEELFDLGVSRTRIHLEEKSICTFTELKEMVRMVVKIGWSYLGVITSGYHIPRTKAMFSHLLNHPDSFPDFTQDILLFREFWMRVSFIPAEEVLCQLDPDYAIHFEKIKASASYRKRLELEKQGLTDIASGTYRFN